MKDSLDRFRKYIAAEQRLPRVFRRDPVVKAKKDREWQDLKKLALEAEGDHIWRRPSRQR